MIDWQTAIALTIVTGAAGALCYRGWKTTFATPSTGCGTQCSQCPSSMPQNPHSRQLVQLGNESPNSID
ncbi:MAG: hypothetical protein ACR2NK_02900 [Mariniblastus sp.]